MEVFRMDIHILDNNFNLVGVLDTYSSLIWRPSYYEVGDFELYLDACTEHLDLLKKNYYLVRGQDISVDRENNIIYKKVMIIKNHQINTDIEGGDYLTVTGRELKFILNQRIVWRQTNLSGNVATAIERLINENAIAPTDTNRVIPNLELDATLEISDTITKQITGESLDVVITEICKAYNLGYDIYIKNNKFKFKLYKGVDRSTVPPYVVFSEEFENILNSEWIRSTENYYNTALVAGEGEGTARKTTTVNGANSGLDRYEIYVDDRDTSTNDGEISASNYLEVLKEHGVEALSEYAITEAFTGEVQHDYSFKYGEDYYLGDVVTMINKYGMTASVRVLSAIESHDENGEKLIPQFEN
jgi:hypothetical protein